jgi:hypothetical protein
MDGSAIKRWTACDGQLRNRQLGDGRLGNYALDGLAIKRLTAFDER